MTDDQLLTGVQKVFEKNRRDKDGFTYTVPSPTSYPYQWFWDSCFHALILRHFDIDRAKAELHALASKQFINGCIPHVIYWDKSHVLDVEWGVEGTSSITQPPILADAVLTLYQTDGDIEFLQSMESTLHKLYEYFLTERIHPARKLVGIINPDESGEDTSPRYDSAQRLAEGHSPQDNYDGRFSLFGKYATCNFEVYPCMSEHFWVEDAAFNSYVVQNLEAMASIMNILGNSDWAERYAEARTHLIDSMRENLLVAGVVKSFTGYNEPVLIEEATWAQFAPLYAGVYTKEEAKQLVEEVLLDTNQFWTPYGLPTTSVQHKSYDVSHHGQEFGASSPNWRGPAWMASNYIVYRGLKRYGYDEIASQLAEKSRKLVEQSGFREYFNPQTGAGLGAENFTWGGLLLEMPV